MKSELLLALFKSVSSLPAFGKFIKRAFDNANCCCVPRSSLSLPGAPLNRGDEAIWEEYEIAALRS
jgi:hypothetical protein